MGVPVPELDDQFQNWNGAEMGSNIYSSRQHKFIVDESFLMFSQWLNFLPCHMTVDWQVLRFMHVFLLHGTRK
jgi:hypothetical protein